MPTIKLFRQIDDSNVINGIFKASGTIPITKGTLVKIQSGWNADLTDTQLLGGAGAAYGNTVSERYGVRAAVTAAGTGDNPIGMTLYDTREVDEHGSKLLYDKQKQDEMQAVLSGQAVPILTKGFVYYSGVTGTPAAGDKAYPGPAGVVDTYALNSLIVPIGRFYGPKDAQGFVLLKLDL